MSWGEPPQQQPNPEQGPYGQDPYGQWGQPAGPEGAPPYGSPPAQDPSYHDAPTQMYGSAQPPQPPQQPPYGPPPGQYGAPQQQPPYGGPADPYGAPQQPYGAQTPPYGAPQGQFGYPAAPPPKKGNGLVIGLVVAAVVIIGGGVGGYLAFHKSTPTTPVAQNTTAPAVNGGSPSGGAATTPPTTPADSGTMTLSASAGSLTQVTTPAANTEVASVKTGVTSGGGSAYDNALFGAYGPTSNGDPTVVLVAQPFSNLDASDASDFESTSPSDAVSQIMSSAGATNVQPETSSDPDAALSCGDLNASGQSVLTCVWDDSVGFGFGYFFNSEDATTAASQTDALRAAAES